MKRIVDDLSPAKIGAPFYQPVDCAAFSVRLRAQPPRSCDTFGSIQDSEYMLNSLTYGWWIGGTLYRFNDPDHIVLTASQTQARTRFNSAVIAGTMMLDSDDLSDPQWQERALKILTNPQINAVAKQGGAFHPRRRRHRFALGQRVRARRWTRSACGRFQLRWRTEVQTELDLARLGLGLDHELQSP